MASKRADDDKALGADLTVSLADFASEVKCEALTATESGPDEYPSGSTPLILPKPVDWYVRPNWVNQVLTTRDADLRGHMVGLSYSKYALHLDELIHGSEAVHQCAPERRRTGMFDANWFNFATWGTVTVTRN